MTYLHTKTYVSSCVDEGQSGSKGNKVTELLCDVTV